MRPALKAMARHCQSGAIAFVFTDWRAAPYMLDAASGVFDEVKQLIVWAKTNAGQGTFYRSAHELIYVFKVSPGEHINNFGLGDKGRITPTSGPTPVRTCSAKAANATLRITRRSRTAR